MIDAKTQKLLQDIVRREGRSFLTYISESFPWTTPGGQEALARFQEMAAEEQQVAAGLGRFLARHRGMPPYFGPYPESFTTLNYVAWEHLLPLLVQYQNRAIAELEHDLTAISDPQARAEVEKVLNMKRRHLQTLKALADGRGDLAAVPRPEPAVAAH